MDECSCGSDCLVCEGCGLPECECTCDGEKERAEEMTRVNEKENSDFELMEEDNDEVDENAVKEEDLGLVFETEEDTFY